VFRFRPRFRGLAWGSVGVGGTLGAVTLATLGGAIVPLATGALGVVLGAAYLLSPTWKLEVVVDEAGLEVRSAKASRFRLAWGDVVKVVASEDTCFVDGGAPERSLLVPGPGAPAPYDLEDKQALVATIVAHVAPEKVRKVASLQEA
jgi:hypothetical protein